MDDNEINIFNGVFKNIYLFKKICSFLNTFNNYERYNDELNLKIKRINLKKVKKYKEIISVDWMIENNHLNLLKWKFMDNSNKSGSFSTILISKNSINKFCEKINRSAKEKEKENEKELCEIFKVIYSKTKHYFIDDPSYLFQFISNNQLKIVKFLLTQEKGVWKINSQQLFASLSNSKMFKLLWEYIQIDGNCDSREFELIYKELLPMSAINYSKESIRKVMKIYHKNVKKVSIGSFCLKLLYTGDFKSFQKFAVPIGFNSEELYTHFLSNFKELKKIEFGHLLILEYLRLDIIKSKVENNYTIESSESQLLNENNIPILELTNEIEIYQFFLNYFQDSIISIFKQNKKKNEFLTFSNEIYRSIDLVDLKSLNFLIDLLIKNGLFDSLNIFENLFKYLIQGYLYNDKEFIFNESFKEIILFVMRACIENKSTLPIISCSLIYNMKYYGLISYLWKEYNFIFENFNYLTYTGNLLYNAILNTNDFEIIKLIYYDLNIRIPPNFNQIEIQVYCPKNPNENEIKNLFEIIIFVQENIIDPNPTLFKFELNSLLSNVAEFDSNGLKILNYLKNKQSPNSQTEFNRALSNIKSSSIIILEFISSVVPNYINNLNLIESTYWSNLNSDGLIRYLILKYQSSLPSITTNNTFDYFYNLIPPFTMVHLNNIELYKITLVYNDLPPNKSIVLHGIATGYLKISLFLMNDYFEKTTTDIFLDFNQFIFECIEASIEALSYQLLKLILSNEINSKIKINFNQILSNYQIQSIYDKSILYKNFDIFKLVVDTFYIKTTNSKIINNNKRLKPSESMLLYLKK